MESILDKEFLHHGTGEIYSELWQEPHITTSPYIKPVGGFWTVPFNDSYFSLWLEYLQENNIQSFYDAISKESVLIKLKSDTKLLTIASDEDFNELRKKGLTIKLDEEIKKEYNNSYYSISELPDYEKIFKLYDAIYVNPWPNNSNNSLKPYSVATMLILNQDVIDYYKTVTLDYDQTFETVIVKSISDKKTIKKPDEKYNELVNIIKNELIPLLENTKEEEKEKIMLIIENIKNKYTNRDNLNQYFNSNLNKTYIIINIIDNIIIEYYNSQKSIKK